MLLTPYFILTLTLSGCAIFERGEEDMDNAPPFPPSNIENSAFLSAEEHAAAKKASKLVGEDSKLLGENKILQDPKARPGSAAEQEIAQLNSKVEALETKIEVIREEMRRMQIRGIQPKLQAEPSPQTATATIRSAGKVRDTTNIASAAHTKAPVALPISIIKQKPKTIERVERDFQNAMKLLREGDNQESANMFYSLAKTNPDHALSSHALFWAGEAGARARNWKISIRHWTKIEREYPRSNYMPEVLAGLSRAYAASGNLSMAKKYRETLVQAFPDSPATLNFMSGDVHRRKE